VAPRRRADQEEFDEALVSNRFSLRGCCSPKPQREEGGPVVGDPALARLAAMTWAGLQDPMVGTEVAALATGGQHRRQRRPAELAAEADQFASRRARKEAQPADRPGRGVLVPKPSERLASRPLLVLDAGVLLARCRCCGWNSPPAAMAAEARAAFAAHACGEQA
jgi:hypothetical protein